MESTRELFIYELGDVLDAETRLVPALRQNEQEARNPDLRKVFAEHRRQTEQQIQRLEEVSRLVGIQPQPNECKGIVGLMEEKQAFLRHNPTPDLLDIFNADTGVKIERYEMSAYESMINLARQLDMDGAERLLKENYKEEEDACNKMQSLSRKLGKQLLKAA